MEFRYYCYDNYDSNHLPSKKIKTNEINDYFYNNFGFHSIILLSEKVKDCDN